MFGGRFGVLSNGLGQIISSNKSAPANRKGGFYPSRLLKNEENKEIFI
jgi:hypothetical protein